MDSAAPEVTWEDPRTFYKLILSTHTPQTADITSPATIIRSLTSLVVARAMCLTGCPKFANQLRRLMSAGVGTPAQKTVSAQTTAMQIAPVLSGCVWWVRLGLTSRLHN